MVALDCGCDQILCIIKPRSEKNICNLCFVNLFETVSPKPRPDAFQQQVVNILHIATFCTIRTGTFSHEVFQLAEWNMTIIICFISYNIG